MTEQSSAALIRVVIVDDHRVLSELLAAALSARAGISVVGAAENATDAVHTVKTFQPDVVLLDYDLPDGDGISLIEKIAAVAPESRILMLTSFADPLILSEAIGAGCAGFLTKRSSTEEIAAAVLAVWSDQTPISPDVVRSLVSKERDGAGSGLTERETEVLRLATRGMSNKEIAAELFLSVNTVRNHTQRVLNKLGAHSKLEAAAIGVRLGIVRR